MKKENYRLVMIILAISIVFIIGFKVRDREKGILFDNLIMEKIHSNTTVIGVNLMKFLSFLGSKYLFIFGGILIFGYFFYTMERRYAWLTIISIPISYIINASLKLTFIRVRPLDYMLIKESGFSFPSGHSMVSMSFYTSMTYILLEKLQVEDKNLRILTWLANFILVGAIGFSRLYLGVHWPTDVICGFILGFIVFYIGKEKTK